MNLLGGSSVGELLNFPVLPSNLKDSTREFAFFSFSKTLEESRPISRPHKYLRTTFYTKSKNLKMGSKGPKAAAIFHVTGFKKFMGVADNPTETIVKNLKDFVEKRGLPPGVTLGSCNVLETAGDGALSTLYTIFESGISNTDSTTSQRVIWLHLGVNSGAAGFEIERQAVNEATFCCPDELGWQPMRLPIISEDGDICQRRKTTCSVDSILKILKAKNFDVVGSEDAGRFVCNFVYYHSLRFAQQKGHKSLFVHVPSFSTIDEETQMRFVSSLFEAIASTC